MAGAVNTVTEIAGGVGEVTGAVGQGMTKEQQEAIDRAAAGQQQAGGEAEAMIGGAAPPPGFAVGGSGLIVPAITGDAARAMDAADEEAIINSLAVGREEGEVYAYEFPGTEGKAQAGLSWIGTDFAYDLLYKRRRPSFRMDAAQMLTWYDERMKSRIFTAAVGLVGPDGREEVGVASAVEWPLRRGSQSERFFNLHAAPTAVRKAKRNAVRDYLGRRYCNAVLAEVLDWTPEDFGSGYAWETEIPPRATWQEEAEALNEHLATLG
mgnify:CR=1 FL=1